MARQFTQLVTVGIIILLVSIAFGAAAVGTKWAQLTLKNPWNPMMKEKIDIGIFNAKAHWVEKLPAGQTCTSSSFVSQRCEIADLEFKGISPRNCESECRENSATVRTKFDFDIDDYTEVMEDAGQDCYNFDDPVGLLIAALALQAFVIIVGLLVCLITTKFGFGYWLMCIWFCGILCSFVLQIVGFILATVYSMRPCEFMADLYDRDVSMAFGFGLASLILTGFATFLFLCTTCILNREESAKDYGSESEEELRQASPMALAQTVVPTVTQLMPVQQPQNNFVVVPQQYAPFPPVQGLYEQQVIYKEGF